jgi:hypothetical protein
MKIVLNESRIGAIGKNIGFGLISFPWLYMFG